MLRDTFLCKLPIAPPNLCSFLGYGWMGCGKEEHKQGNYMRLVQKYAGRYMVCVHTKSACDAWITATVEPPITDPPTSGQPLYNGHWLWHQLKLLQN